MNERYSCEGEEFEAIYGIRAKTKCTIYTYNGWYVVEDSTNINYAGKNFEFYKGIDVEEIQDSDTFQSSVEIDSLENLIKEVDDYEGN